MRNVLAPAEAANAAALVVGLIALLPAFRCRRLLQATALQIVAPWLLLAIVSYVVASAAFLADVSTAWVESLRIGAAVLTAALGVAVLGARGPRERAWHIILVTYTVVLLFPLLEQAVTGRWQAGTRPSLDWLRVALLLLIATLTAANYVVSRLRLAISAGSIAAALQAILASAWHTPRRDTIFAVSAMIVAGSVLSCSSVRLVSRGKKPLECRWDLVRDLWGIAWAYRIQERFNEETNRKGWHARITWTGVIEPDDPVSRARVIALFEGLVRRFAPADWFARFCGFPAGAAPALREGKEDGE